MADISMLSRLRVLVVGLGKEGTALATYLARHGFNVTATDSRPAEKLGTTPAALAALGIPMVLGEHPLSLLGKADLLFVSPGISLDIPFLKAARAQKIPLSTESRLFCHLCPAPIVGITGSSGKTTTTTLVGKMMEAAGRKTWVGGNIGRPLIEVVDQVSQADVVVMELSSFQLEYFHARLNQGVRGDPALIALLNSWSPPISTVLNITPNHLDRHPSMKHYVRAKRAIVDYQRSEGVIIMNLDNDMTRTIGGQFPNKVRWFSLEAQAPGGAGLAGSNLVLLDETGQAQVVANRQEVKLRGPHNLSNILAACLLAREIDASIEAMRRVITTFSGVEHRLQFVREYQGISYYNDSISTSPERLIAALHSFSEPIVLLAGGRDKKLPWEEAARLIIHKTHEVILFGEASELITRAIDKADQEITSTRTTIHQCANLDEAVKRAFQVARAGDVVLLSPGCASYDAFLDYVERGQRFKELVLQL